MVVNRVVTCRCPGVIKGRQTHRRSCRDLDDRHAVQRLRPSQGGPPVRGNDVLIGAQVSMQQQHRDFCSWDVFVLWSSGVPTRLDPE